MADFINTLQLPQGDDEIATPDALAHWLIERSLLGPEDTVSVEDVTAAHAFREALRDLTDAHTDGTQLPQEALAVLDSAAESAAMRFSIDRTRLAPVLDPATVGIAGAFGRILALIYDAERAGTWRRVKACRKDSCRWAFFDYSKNRSGAWCNMQTCGNQAKAARRRARTRGDASIKSGTNEASPAR